MYNSVSLPKLRTKYSLVYKGKSEVREQIGNTVCDYTHMKKTLLFVRLYHGWILQRQRQKQMWYLRREEVIKMPRPTSSNSGRQ